MTDYRLSEHKYPESEFLYQTIEMAKSDEEYDLEPGNGHGKLHNSLETLISEQRVNKEKIFDKRPPCFYKHYSMTNISPPAPPSTPTSSMATCSTPMPSPPYTSVLTEENEERLNNSAEQFYYVNSSSMRFPPRYMKLVRDQRNTDTELARLLNVVSITSRKQNSAHDGGIGTNGGVGGGGGGGGSNGGNCGNGGIGIGITGDSSLALTKFNDLSKCHPERGISAHSRTIRKLNLSTKSYKLHHRSNPKEFFREPDEDSVSAPEYDSQEEHTLSRRLSRFKFTKRYMHTRRQRRFARFEHQERMEEIVDSFGTTMKINDI